MPDAESTIKGSAELWQYMRRMRPWIHTFGILVPLMQIFFFFLSFKQIAEISPKWKSSPYPLALLLAAGYASLVPFASRLDVSGLLWLLSTFPLVFAQYLLNAFWRQVEPPEARVRQAFSIEEVLFLILGVLGMIFYLLMIIISPILIKFLGQAYKF